MTLVDTDVIIWFLRGHRKAARELERLGEFAVSAVTYIELVQGMRNKEELRGLRLALRDWGTRVLPITDDISDRATFYVEEHFLRANLRIADALIAATAAVHAIPLLTGNVKRYRVILGLPLRVFKP